MLVLVWLVRIHRAVDNYFENLLCPPHFPGISPEKKFSSLGVDDVYLIGESDV